MSNHPEPPWRLIAALLAVKLLVLALDPSVRLFMDDSATFLRSALSDWVAPDRSFTYALVLRIGAVATHRLFAMVLIQTALGVCTALILCELLRQVFKLRAALAAILALLFALGPEQLFYERMILAESAGTLALALTLACGLWYLRRGRWPWLVAAALCGISAVSLRMNLLPVVLGMAALPPLARLLGDREQPTRRRWAVATLHLGVAVLATLLCHVGYRHWYAARYGQSQADYLAYAGYFRLGLVAPLVKPGHLQGLGLPEHLLARVEVPLPDRLQREAQIWNPAGLDNRLRQAVGDERGNAVAGTIATRALRDDPIGLLRLGWLTLGDYFDPVQVRARMEDDLGWRRPPAPDALAPLRALFRDVDASLSTGRSLTADYFAASAPWLIACLILLGPLGILTIVVLWHRQRAAATVLGLASLGLVAGDVLFAHIISFRYLHPFPFFIFLNIGAMLALRWPQSNRIGAVAPTDHSSARLGGPILACACCDPRYTQ